MMNKTTKILLLAGGAVAFFYGPTLWAVYNLTPKLVMLLPTGITDTKLDLVATINLRNASPFRVDMQKIKGDILLNGFKVAQFDQLQEFPILANSDQSINIQFTVDAQTIGNQVFAQLVAQNLQNIVLNTRGTLTANNKTIPFDMVWTVNDLKGRI
jgi:LEA14-like dessication related protein